MSLLDNTLQLVEFCLGANKLSCKRCGDETCPYIDDLDCQDTLLARCLPHLEELCTVESKESSKVTEVVKWLRICISTDTDNDDCKLCPYKASSGCVDNMLKDINVLLGRRELHE